jgi:hypothetical protein
MFLLIAYFLFGACTSPSIESNNKFKGKSDIDTLMDSIPNEVKKIMAVYPAVIGYSQNYILLSDGTRLLYDDGKTKAQSELLENPDIEDMFAYRYKHWNDTPIPKFYDPGRIRVDSFFMKIYGQTKEDVQKNLVRVRWCPKLVNQEIQVTRINNVHLKIDSISRELDELPQYKEYLQKIGGTFNWRKISGTTRMSMHSFGMTIDINAQFSHYWQWDCQCKNENSDLTYRNKIPIEIVRIFEKYGFIWGGNWYHYDTMHFEYRPELF